MFEIGIQLRKERGADNVFDFSIGNPDVEPPAAVIAALRRVVAENRPRSHGYMPNAGFPEVRAAIAGSLAARTGIAFSADDVLMTTGAAGAINIVLKSILDPGDEVILLNPCFPEYRLYVENHAGSVVSVETDECFLPDVRRISEAITPRTKALIVNSPNNPTGAVYDAGVLRARHSRSRADTGHQRRALSPAGLRRAQASRDARHHPEIGAGLVVVEGHGDCRRAHRLSGDSPAS